MLKRMLWIFVLSIFITSAQAKVVLITGASGDIGIGLVKYYLSNNDIVLSQYFTNKEELEKLKVQYPQQLTLIQADFSAPESVNKFWETVLKSNDQIDILINSTGIEKEDVSLKQIQTTMNINYLSPRLICDYTVENFLQKKKSGIIVNLGSRGAYRGLPKGYYTYADSKAALTKYSQDLARDNAIHNISVYVVAPGPVEGKMFKGLKDDVRTQCLESMPTGRPVSVNEVVDMIALLTSGKVPNATGGVFDLMGASWAH
jgi:NAD(P)-dependent dehydrogenase (short-subunit alcohol dehydrogenase family)